MATITAGSSKTFTAQVDNSSFVVIAPGGSIGQVVDQNGNIQPIGPNGTRRTFGPLNELQSITVSMQIGNASVELNGWSGGIPITAETNSTGQTVLDDASRAALVSTGIVQRTPYTGVIASRCGVPGALASANKQLMCRSKHTAMDNITSMQLVFSNWYVKATATVGENLPGATTDYQFSIEYPAGTIAAIGTFGGSTQGTAADGANIISDPINLAIPAGAIFFVRTWTNSTAGVMYRTPAGNLNTTGGVPTSGECVAFGATTPNLVATPGGFTNANTTLYYSPTAIIGLTTRPSIFITGDSRQCNNGGADSTTDGFGLAGELGRSLGRSFATLTASCASEKVNVIVGTPSLYARRLALAQYCSHVACGYGINDIFVDSRTSAQVLADLQSLWALFGTKPVFQQTLSPVSTSSDSWATTGNQTTHASNAQRTALNDLIRMMPQGIDGMFDVADQVESARNSGLWKAPSYTADGIHGASVANVAIAASGVVKI